jgi:hypothetical protein
VYPQQFSAAIFRSNFPQQFSAAIFRSKFPQQYFKLMLIFYDFA